MSTGLDAALQLQQYMLNKHWDGALIVGPDPIGRIHWRVTRFVRSYLPWLPGDDRYVYLQGQAYWIKANLLLFALTGESGYLEYAQECADSVVQRQSADGVWLHPPMRERRGFVSSVEGIWASLGLLSAYKEMRKPAYLDAACKWYDVQINRIGFQQVQDGLAANYYAHSNSRVPNVTTMLMWLAAELSQATGDPRYLGHTDGMLRFIAHAQLDSGELPYALGVRMHFQCYQYNAFQFRDLAQYYELTGDERVRPVLTRAAHFLSSGVTARGSCRYDCSRENPETNYWTAALAAALWTAERLGLGQYQALSERAHQRVLSRQNSDGSFDFSDQNYGFLADRRSYPRQQAMILYCLLVTAQEQH